MKPHNLMREKCVALLEQLGFVSVTFLFGRTGRGPSAGACLRVSGTSPMIIAHDVREDHSAVLEVRDENGAFLGTMILRAESYPFVKTVLYSVSLYPYNKVAA